MNWVFLDFSRWDYDVAAPLVRPLGGSQSALCYLATELVRQGQRVTTVTGLKQSREVNGVRCLSYGQMLPEIFAPVDTVAIVLNGVAECVRQLRQQIPAGRPIVLWTQHAHDQPAILALRDPTIAPLWDRIICISDWQKGMYEREFGIPASKIQILRNAVSPIFENMFHDAAHLAAAKAGTMRLAYTSTPFRGLDALALFFPHIFQRHSHCRLDVYSSMQVYGQPASQDEFQPLYNKLRAMAGVVYRGSVSQTELARELAQTSILAYPNTFPETSCIAVMEALAAGLLVVTSDLGALPETCAGFARLIPPIAPGRGAEAFIVDFARALDAAMIELITNRDAVLQQRFEQTQAINRTCTWAIRAREWQQLAQTWLSQQVR